MNRAAALVSAMKILKWSVIPMCCNEKIGPRLLLATMATFALLFSFVASAQQPPDSGTLIEQQQKQEQARPPAAPAPAPPQAAPSRSTVREPLDRQIEFGFEKPGVAPVLRLELPLEGNTISVPTCTEEMKKAKSCE